VADHAQPNLASPYTDLLGTLKARLDDQSRALDPATTSATNLPTGTVRWNDAAGKWQKNSGTAAAPNWVDLAETYDILTNLWGTTRVLTIGSTGRYVNGSANITWSLEDIGISTFMVYLNSSATPAEAKQRLAIPESVFAHSVYTSVSGVGTTETQVSISSITVNKGGALQSNYFEAPRAGHVRCRVNEILFSQVSGSFVIPSARFSRNGIFDFSGFTSIPLTTVENWLPCEAGDRFALWVSCGGSGGPSGNFVLKGISFEMMD
jgi:hypothetical protein